MFMQMCVASSTVSLLVVVLLFITEISDSQVDDNVSLVFDCGNSYTVQNKVDIIFSSIIIIFIVFDIEVFIIW